VIPRACELEVVADISVREDVGGQVVFAVFFGVKVQVLFGAAVRIQVCHPVLEDGDAIFGVLRGKLLIPAIHGGALDGLQGLLKCGLQVCEALGVLRARGVARASGFRGFLDEDVFVGGAASS
jgi:hypothetical protein